MAKNQKITIQHKMLHRYLSGLMLVVLMVTILGSAAAGARTNTITYRAIVIFFILSFIKYILMKTWLSWEEIRSAEARSKRK